MAHQVTFIAEDNRSVLIFQTKDDLFGFVTDSFRRMSERAICERGYFAAALSGGRTPVDLYGRLAAHEERFDWDRIHIFLVDERFVPDTDSESNYRMIRETLLDRVDIPAKNVHPIFTGEADPRISVQKYEKELIRFLKPPSGGIPVLDLVMLGLGEDGHTASLFPGTPVIEERQRFVRAVLPGKGKVPRVTLTFPVINHARNIFFIVTGKGKEAVVRRVVEERDPSLPASLVKPEQGELFFLCDSQAASMLTTSKLEG